MNIIKMIFAPLVYAYILISSSPFVFFLPLLNLVHLCMACTLSYVYGEGVLREGILGLSAQFVRAVGEKLFSKKLFSKLGCLREVVLEKPFCTKPFYASQPGSCSWRSRSARRGSASPYAEGATPTLSTRIENRSRRLGPTGDRRS